ncbi:MAG: hypothetical protein U0350_36345 [Caldilineaceae bacterium]
MNLITNGGFDGNLYRWQGSGAILLTDGYPRLGCARLTSGQSIYTDQGIGLGENYLHTLHFFYKVSDGATLTANYGNISQAFAGSPSDTWREGILGFALDAGGNSPMLFAATSGVCLVDSVTLLQGALPIHRAAIAAAVAARLSSLVTDAGLSATASASGPEGDYAAPIDEALRALGAVNNWGDPDVTALDPAKVNDVIDAAQNALLARLRATYALETDVRLGPQQESRSQIMSNLGLLAGGSGGGKGGARVGSGKLTNGDWRR